MHPTAALAAALLLPLAGCLDGPLSVDKPGTGEARSVDLPGLDLRASIAKAGDRLRLDATLANDGSRTFQMSGICASPWATSLVDDQGRTLSLEAPRAVCAAFGLAPLAPGTKLRQNWTWDGNVWDGGHGPTHATPGLYSWHVRFTAYTGTGTDNPGQAQALDTGIQVRVG